METAERVVAVPQLLADAWAMEERTGHAGIVAAVMREVLRGGQRQAMVEALAHFAALALPQEPDFAVWLQSVWGRARAMLEG
jgi:hypothetical protein